jgi:methylglutaconyl-CoA hydratase
MDYIITSRKGPIYEITLNRPDKRNALNSEFVSELKQAFADANEDERIRVVILKANGKAFSAGADLAYLQQLQQNTYEENLQDSTHLMELFKLMYYHKKIIIAQVEGHAIAGGCGLATVCDFVFSVPEAKFGYTEVKIGFIPAIVMFFLIRKIGEARSRELLLTGKLIDAGYASNIGIVNEVIEAVTVEAAVFDFATKLSSETSPQAIALTRKMLADIQTMDADAALHYAASQNATARSTEDCKKGIRSFLNKEDIIW